MDHENPKLIRFTRQGVWCDECGEEVTADQILDHDVGRAYHICPECGTPGRV